LLTASIKPHLYIRLQSRWGGRCSWSSATSGAS